ncbi:WD40/YVTN/BNR-like repeat-containing protein [Solidesulfovibrio sp.]
MCCLVLVLAQIATAWGQGPALIPIGYGGGGRFTALAVDRSNPDLVAVGSDVAGFFLSHDGGDRFLPRGAGLKGLAVAGLAFDPQAAGTLAILTDEGLYRSRDGGETTERLADLGYADRFFGSTLLLPLGDDLIVATRTKGIFRVSWRQTVPVVTPLPGLSRRKPNSLAVLGDELFAATDAGVWVWRGGQWTSSNQGLAGGNNVTDMAATPEAGLYAVEERSGLWRYNPGKKAWERPGPLPALPPGAKGPVRFKALALDPKTPGRVFLASHPEYWPYLLFVSNDGGKEFALATDFALAPDGAPNYAKGLESIEALAFSSDGGTLFVADWWNLWRSRDSGKHFDQLHKGLQNTVVKAVTSLPGQAGAIVAATADNGLMASSDAGHTWTRTMNGVADGHVVDMRFSPRDSAKRYLLADPWQSGPRGGTVRLHLFRSLDSGASWQSLPVMVPARPLPGDYASGLPTLLAIDPADDDVVYLGSNGHGLYKVRVPDLERDPAAAVTDLARALPRTTFFGPQSLLLFPDLPGLLVAATVGGGIRRSQDGGATWTAVTDPSLFVFCLAADPSQPGHLLAGLPEKGLLQSRDFGKTWTRLALPGERPDHIAVQSIAFDPARPGLVAVGTAAYDLKAAEGVYLSYDQGATFVRVPSAMAPVGVTALAPGPGGILAGFNGLGLWRLDAGR